MSRMFEIPPYPVISTPYMIQYTREILEVIQKKYNIHCKVVAVPPPSSLTTSPGSTSSPSTSSYSTPTTPEKKPAKIGKTASPVTNCQCQVCGKQFSRQWLLQGHLRTHTGEKPFKCEICDKHFADKSNLRAHVQTHSGRKPFRCARCGKRFALKSYLSKHEESKCVRQINWAV